MFFIMSTDMSMMKNSLLHGNPVRDHSSNCRGLFIIHTTPAIARDSRKNRVVCMNFTEMNIYVINECILLGKTCKGPSTHSEYPIWEVDLFLEIVFNFKLTA